MLNQEIVKINARDYGIEESKAKQDAERKAKSAPDKEKLLKFAKGIIDLKYPELTTKEAKHILQTANMYLIKVHDDIIKKAGEL